MHQAKRCLLDLIGVAAAGSQLPSSRIIRSVAASQFGGTGGYFLFDGRSASATGAALANATTIDGFDAHDGHPLTKGHAGCGALAGAAGRLRGDGSALSGARGARPSGRRLRGGDPRRHRAARHGRRVPHVGRVGVARRRGHRRAHSGAGRGGDPRGAGDCRVSMARAAR